MALARAIILSEFLDDGSPEAGVLLEADQRCIPDAKQRLIAQPRPVGRCGAVTQRRV